MKKIYHHLGTIESTQTHAKQQLAFLDPQALTIFSADSQTKGRGRFERPWHSPPNVNLYVTFCFTLPPNHPPAHNITQIIALCLCKLLKNMDVKIKWPNDLLSQKKKIGGILSELISTQHQWMLCGVGLNINATSEELKNIDQAATSILEQTNQLTDRSILLDELSDSLIDMLAIFFKEGFAPFLQEYRDFCLHQIGDLIYFNKAEPMQFRGIDTDGALLVQNKEGKKEKHYSGTLVT